MKTISTESYLALRMPCSRGVERSRTPGAMTGVKMRRLRRWVGLGIICIVGSSACGDDGLTADRDAGTDLGGDAPRRDASDAAGADAGLNGNDLGVGGAGVDMSMADAGAGDLGGSDGGSPGYRISQGNDGFRELGSGELLLQSRTESTASVPLPFAFDVFGVSYPPGTPLSISSYGALVLGAGTATVGPNRPLSEVRGRTIIAPFWHPMDMRGGGVSYRGRGARGLTVIYDRGSGAVDVELSLIPAGNRIEMVYKRDTSGFAATIGVTDGTLVSEPPCSPQCSPRAGDIITFFPAGQTQAGPDLRPVAIAGGALPGRVAPRARLPVPDVEIANRGNAGSIGIYRYLATPLGRSFLVDVEALDMYADFFPAVPPGGSATAGAGVGGGQLQFPSAVGTYEVAVWLDQAGADLDRGDNLLRLGTVSVEDSLPCGITTSSLPNGQAGQAYRAQLMTVATCSAPTWSVQPALPGGLSLDPATGEITGTPAMASVATYTFRATKMGFQDGVQLLNLVIQ